MALKIQFVSYAKELLELFGKPFTAVQLLQIS